MTKKHAYTLIEIVVVLIIIGIIVAVMFNSLKSQNYADKDRYAKVTKVLDFISQASAKIIELEPKQCPAGAFMVKRAGSTSWEFSIYKTNGTSAASATDIVNLLGKYLKYESNVINFCDYTSYCTSAEIKGAKVAGDIYFGIEKFSSIKDCATYKMPNDTATYPAPTKFNPKTGNNDKVKCWGKLYVDINGEKATNTYGEDVFIFNLGEYGIVK